MFEFPWEIQWKIDQDMIKVIEKFKQCFKLIEDPQ